MTWMQKHVDTVVVLGGILGAVLWMNGKFNEMQKEITIIKTVLIIRGILPEQLVAKENGK